MRKADVIIWARRASFVRLIQPTDVILKNRCLLPEDTVKSGSKTRSYYGQTFGDQSNQ